jgi:hypothetical protein
MQEEDYVVLDCLLMQAEGVCPPDEHDFRQRVLLHGIANFLLKEYHLKNSTEETK